MALTVAVGVWLVLAALLGLLRGVRAGLMTIGGTLLTAALVELWAEPIATWVRVSFRPEQPAGPAFAATATAFVLTAGLLGYGGGALLPRQRASAPAPPLLERGLGALLGVLNGALVAAYLLRYWLASGGAGGAAEAAVAASAVAALLVTWLPWYILAMAAGLGGVIIVRLARNLLVRSAARRSAAGTSVASAPSLAEADRRLSDKINDALKK